MPRTYRKSYRKGSSKYGYPKARGYYPGRSGRSIGRWGSFKHGFSSAWSAANKALKMAASIKKLINVEYKYVDCGTSQIADGSQIGYTPANTTFTLLNGCAQGNTQTTRNGISLLAKSIAGSFDLYRNVAGTDTQCIRYMICSYPHSEGTAPDMSRIFTNSADYASTRNKEYPYEVRIFKEGRVQVDSTQKAFKHVKFFIPLNFHVKFSGTGSAYTDISRNSLFFYIWCDQAANKPCITHFQTRFQYIDN